MCARSTIVSVGISGCGCSKPVNHNTEPKLGLWTKPFCLVCFFLVKLGSLPTQLTASPQVAAPLQPLARVRDRSVVRRGAQFTSHSRERRKLQLPSRPAAGSLLLPLLPLQPAAGRRWAFICGPGGRAPDPSDLPRRQFFTRRRPAARSRVQLCVHASPEPGGKGSVPGAPRGWSSACSSPLLRASWRWARWGRAAGWGRGARVLREARGASHCASLRSARPPAGARARQVIHHAPATMNRAGRKGGWGTPASPKCPPCVAWKADSAAWKWSPREAPSSCCVAWKFGERVVQELRGSPLPLV